MRQFRVQDGVRVRLWYGLYLGATEVRLPAQRKLPSPIFIFPVWDFIPCVTVVKIFLVKPLNCDFRRNSLMHHEIYFLRNCPIHPTQIAILKLEPEMETIPVTRA